MTDRLGTVRDIVNAAGAVINHLDYDSFGQLLSQTNPAVGDRYTYTGREYDATLGQYYYRAASTTRVWAVSRQQTPSPSPPVTRTCTATSATAR